MKKHHMYKWLGLKKKKNAIFTGGFFKTITTTFLLGSVTNTEYGPSVPQLQVQLQRFGYCTWQ